MGEKALLEDVSSEATCRINGVARTGHALRAGHNARWPFAGPKGRLELGASCRPRWCSTLFSLTVLTAFRRTQAHSLTGPPRRVRNLRAAWLFVPLVEISRHAGYQAVAGGPPRRSHVSLRCLNLPQRRFSFSHLPATQDFLTYHIEYG